MSLEIPTAQPWKALLYISAYIQRHEKLLAIVLAALLIWGVTGKIENVITAHDQRVLAADKSTLQDQADKNAAIAQANAQLAAQAQAQAAATAAANKQLEQSNNALAAALTARQANDASLPPSDVAARIELLAKLPAASVVPTTTGYTVTSPAAVSILQDLDTVGTLTGENVNLKAETVNDQKEIATDVLLINGLNSQVSGLNLQLGAATKVCKDQVAVTKAEARKSKRRWFVAGFVAGITVDILVKLGIR